MPGPPADFQLTGGASRRQLGSYGEKQEKGEGRGEKGVGVILSGAREAGEVEGPPNADPPKRGS
jgi:hypothetical protein